MPQRRSGKPESFGAGDQLRAFISPCICVGFACRRRLLAKQAVTHVQRETPVQPDIEALLAAADERSALLYSAESRHGLPLSALLSADVRFFVAQRAGRAVGCGGYMPLAQQAAEMKRLFVDPVARGQGVAERIVRAVEHAAIAEGVQTLFLETGIKSFEAIRLYKRMGFTECDPFAAYQPNSLSVFMMKLLPRLNDGHGSTRALRL